MAARDVLLGEICFDGNRDKVNKDFDLNEPSL
jgi:hypothetical protein